LKVESKEEAIFIVATRGKVVGHKGKIEESKRKEEEKETTERVMKKQRNNRPKQTARPPISVEASNPPQPSNRKREEVSEEELRERRRQKRLELEAELERSRQESAVKEIEKKMKKMEKRKEQESAAISEVVRYAKINKIAIAPTNAQRRNEVQFIREVSQMGFSLQK
jgi:hypothetical protein